MVLFDRPGNKARAEKDDDAKCDINLPAEQHQPQGERCSRNDRYQGCFHGIRLPHSTTFAAPADTGPSVREKSTDGLRLDNFRATGAIGPIQDAVSAVAGIFAPRTESAIVVGITSASPRSELKRIETVLETPRSCIVTP